MSALHEVIHMDSDTAEVYVFAGAMIQPALKDDDFLADVLAARDYPNDVHLWWLGQSGFLLQWQGHHLLFDPYLSDSLTHKYASTDKPHVRMTERVIAPERLDFIDVVTSSHNHTDHLDKETLVPLMKANPKMQLVVPEANRGFVSDRLGVVLEYPRGLDVEQTKRFGVFEITGVPAAHPTLEKDEWGHYKFLGYIVQCGGFKIYHSGDTLLYETMVPKLALIQPDVALLPINGDYPERRVAGNLNGREAATLAKDIGARLVIPCHYEMFEFNTASPDEFVRAAKELNQPHRVLRAGERWSSSEFDQAFTESGA
jgi:L-ascorbate metabolism protein UlaG (beta-lactamase superfamily)